MANRLDHLDGHQLVERAPKVAVVGAQHLDPVRHAALADQPLDEGVLLARDGGGGDAAAVAVRRVHREAAPAGPDLDHAIVWRERELATDAVELGARGVGHRGVRALEDPRRVGERLVEEQREEVVAEVVVRADVAPSAGPGVAPREVAEPGEDAGDCRRASLHGVGGADVAHEHPNQRDKIARAPIAVHVGLGRSQAAAEQHAPVEALPMHVEAHRIPVHDRNAELRLAPGVVQQQAARAERTQPALHQGARPAPTAHAAGRRGAQGAGDGQRRETLVHRPALIARLSAPCASTRAVGPTPRPDSRNPLVDPMHGPGTSARLGDSTLRPTGCLVRSFG